MVLLLLLRVCRMMVPSSPLSSFCSDDEGLLLLLLIQVRTSSQVNLFLFLRLACVLACVYIGAPFHRSRCAYLSKDLYGDTALTRETREFSKMLLALLCNLHAGGIKTTAVRPAAGRSFLRFYRNRRVFTRNSFLKERALGVQDCCENREACARTRTEKSRYWSWRLLRRRQSVPLVRRCHFILYFPTCFAPHSRHFFLHKHVNVPTFSRAMLYAGVQFVGVEHYFLSRNLSTCTSISRRNKRQYGRSPGGYVGCPWGELSKHGPR